MLLGEIAMSDIARILVSPRFSASWRIFSIRIEITRQFVFVLVVVRDGSIIIAFGSNPNIWFACHKIHPFLRIILRLFAKEINGLLCLKFVLLILWSC